MRRLALILASTLGAGAAFGQQLQTGDYLGTLEVGATPLRMALHVTRGADGAWGATIDSLDQGAMGMPAKITVDGARVTLTSNIGATFEGTLNAAGTAITGTFTQRAMSLPLTFAKVDRIVGPARPQHPKRPFPYKEEDVTIANGPVSLAGTLTLPNGAGPFAAAILLTGSGPQDRDSTLFEHKPFLVLSDHLTRQGFAVLRMDDRGVGKSTGSLPSSTYDDMSGDAQAAHAFLQSRKEINGKAIGVIGHSEGAAIAQLSASRNPAIAFIVLLAGPGVAGDELLYEQGQLTVKAMGGSKAQLDRQRRVQQTFLQALKAETDNKTLVAKLREAVAKFKAELPPEELAAAGLAFDQQMEGEIRRATLPPFQSLVRYDPAPVLRKVACPVLALNGTLDTQVAHYQNLPAVAAALAATANPDYTVAALPGLNHLFQTAKSGAVMEYREIEETFAPKALRTISDWLKSRF